MTELVATERWWVMSDQAIVGVLLRVEQGLITAREGHTLLREHTEREKQRRWERRNDDPVRLYGS